MAAMEGQDRRVKRTQQLLARALIALTLEKGYEAVTIRDVTERADVGYATFFRHYHDKDALLQDVSDVVLAELTALLQLPSETNDPAAVGALIFGYVRDHSEMCRVLLGTRGSQALVRRIVEQGANSVLEQHGERADSPVPIAVAAHHLVASSIALIQWWLDHNMPYSPERMSIMYDVLIVRPTAAAAFAG